MDGAMARMQTMGSRLLLISALVVTFPCYLAPARADDRATCFRDTGDPGAVAACTRLIQSKRFKGNALGRTYGWRALHLGSEG